MIDQLICCLNGVLKFQSMEHILITTLWDQDEATKTLPTNQIGSVAKFFAGVWQILLNFGKHMQIRSWHAKAFALAEENQI